MGARYRVAGSTPWWDGVVQHAGTALSYLNFFDADAAWRLVHELRLDAPDKKAVAIIKHANASGAALGSSLADACLLYTSQHGVLAASTRHALARAAFAHTASYDAQIVRWFDEGGEIGEAPTGVDAQLTTTLHLSLERAALTRYGENPHQVGCLLYTSRCV